MLNKYRLYSNRETKDTIFELWGGSTKHPDCRFFYSDFKKSLLWNENDQIFPWLCECASKMNFPFHTKEIIKFAISVGYLSLD